ncbi:cell filamentation protein [Dyadobacter sp. SG02]|uniref:Fic/DOC family protein n=1 Tax=Dyadobacter sp. SG02 TaxID=1855291 RepID=UPI0008CA9EB8|nr:Fic family protein [Dyadobacter sp. SG02]SEJ73283.1 cell filamentation protein [Dyadobacter sp. SG02]
MNDGTDYTPSIDDNLLNLTDKDLLNLYEASGIAKCEITIQELDEDADLDISLILEIHRTAFGELYSWAGKWRTIDVQVGKLSPPHPSQVPALMYQYADHVNYRLKRVAKKDEVAELLAYLHHRFVWIHPFNNGNGRTARLLLNAAAMLKGFEPIQLYHREGEARVKYIEALRKGDEGDISALTALILNELTPF